MKNALNKALRRNNCAQDLHYDTQNMTNGRLYLL